ncbi:small G protein signaling modulator 2 isoform X1 [Selaginella moellendorffii]|uniref:small G protein signaling modulator 2 isoform X1 n=1 Tax=Selaginella moellendorffii TaxID=88036 RepID=UPI000D1D0A06|nr:small G protein signaling modulator 2 isoform X1 [Selaginella moellendorffii]|eukprot:XP_024534015.1 small G protein signaling modulator 2 isoform X1 [Selaginella moellendorffii]
MSRDWDESRWMCGPAVGPRMFLKAASTVGGGHNTSNSSGIAQPQPAAQAPSFIESAKTSKRLKPEKWRAAFDKEGRAVGFHKILKAIVSGGLCLWCQGVDHSIRAEVWEFLLGCYSLGTTAEYRQQLRHARRIRYQELIEQCHLMHGSIGSGTLAYTVGTKIMDVRVTSKSTTREEHTTLNEVATSFKEKIASWSEERFQAAQDLENFEDSRESFEEGDLLIQEDLAPKKSSEAGSPSDEGTDSGPSEGEVDNSFSNDDGSQLPDYLRLPVRTLFPTYVMDSTTSSTKDRTSGATDKAENKDLQLHTLNDDDDNSIVTILNENETPESANEQPEVTNEVKREEGDTTRSPEKQEDLKVPSGGGAFRDEKVADWLWTLHRIVVDVVRTDRHLKFYEDSKNMARMSDILAVYAWVDPATGYCQGMSDLLSPFILIYEDDADAFWCFESLLRRVRQNFQMDGPIGVMRQLQALTTILELTDVYVFKHFVHIGADSFLFAFRMLLVLFRRELSFGEALCMWEMMWAADFDNGISWALEYHCPELLIVKDPTPVDETLPEDDSKAMSPLYTFQDQSLDTSPLEDNDRVGYLSRSPLCGLRAGNFWPRHSRHKIRTVSSLLGKTGDDELSVFVVAAILVLNRTRFMKDVHSMDDAIKAFNEIQMKIKVRSCIRTAIKLRRKYQRQLVRRAALENKASAIQRQKQRHGGA